MKPLVNRTKEKRKKYTLMQLLRLAAPISYHSSFYIYEVKAVALTTHTRKTITEHFFFFYFDIWESKSVWYKNGFAFFVYIIPLMCVSVCVKCECGSKIYSK